MRRDLASLMDVEANGAMGVTQRQLDKTRPSGRTHHRHAPTGAKQRCRRARGSSETDSLKVFDYPILAWFDALE